MAKANYHQIRRQKELARKTRQQEKQQRRLAAKADELTPSDVTAAGPMGSGLMAGGADESTVSVDEPEAGSTGSGDEQSPTHS